MILKNYQVMDINFFLQGPVSNLTIIPSTKNVSLNWSHRINYFDDGLFI